MKQTIIIANKGSETIKNLSVFNGHKEQGHIEYSYLINDKPSDYQSAKPLQKECGLIHKRSTDANNAFLPIEIITNDKFMNPAYLTSTAVLDPNRNLSGSIIHRMREPIVLVNIVIPEIKPSEILELDIYYVINK